MVARTKPNGGLIVTFTRANNTILHDQQHATDEVHALKVAMGMMLQLNELWEGDELKVTRGSPGNDNIKLPLR